LFLFALLHARRGHEAYQQHRRNQEEFTPVSYNPKKGTTIKAKEQTKYLITKQKNIGEKEYLAEDLAKNKLLTRHCLHMEYLFLNYYLGAFVFFVGMVVFYLLFKRIICHILIVLAVDIVHLLLSGILSLVIWRFWPFGFDITYGLLSFPALIAEIVVIISSYWVIKYFTVRKQY